MFKNREKGITIIVLIVICVVVLIVINMLLGLLIGKKLANNETPKFDNYTVVEPEKIFDWEYTIDSNTNIATITGYKGSDTVVTIPNHIDGVPVKKIVGNRKTYDRAWEEDVQSSVWKKQICMIKDFKGITPYCQDTIRKVTISNGIEEIGQNAFEFSLKLEEIIIPDSVKKIGDYAFYACTALSKINLSKNITEIPTGSFKYCYDLRTIDIPENISRIESYSFAECRNLSEVTIPNTVKVVDDYAFENNSNLEINVSFEKEQIPEGWKSKWANNVKKINYEK